MNAPANQLTVAEKASTRDVTILSGAAGSSIAPQNLGEVIRFAEVMCKADIALPPHLRGNAGACMAVAIQALEWQMSPFAVASKSYAVKGAIAYEAQLIAAVVNTRSGIKGRLKYDFRGEGDDLTCVVRGILDGEECTYETPPFGAIQPKNSPLWKTDPRQQLGYYAARSWARRHCPEVLLGVYDRDEVEHFGPDNAKDITQPSVLTRLREQQEPAGAREGFTLSHVAAETAALSGEPAIDQEPSDAPPPGIPSSDAGGDDLASSPDITADQSALVGGSTEEEEAAVNQKGEQVSPDQQEGSDSPDPASSSADRAELIVKFLEISSNDLAPQERVDIMKDALPDWCAKVDSDFVRAVYQTAVKVVKGELKPDAARKYLEGLL